MLIIMLLPQLVLLGSFLKTVSIASFSVTTVKFCSLLYLSVNAFNMGGFCFPCSFLPRITNAL